MTCEGENCEQAGPGQIFSAVSVVNREDLLYTVDEFPVNLLSTEDLCIGTCPSTFIDTKSLSQLNTQVDTSAHKLGRGLHISAVSAAIEINFFV